MKDQITNTILKENKVGGLTLQDIRIYYKAPVIKTAQYWQKMRPKKKKNQWTEQRAKKQTPINTVN